jgi:hypothetical protein
MEEAMRHPVLIVIASVLLGVGTAAAAQADDTYLYPPAGDVGPPLATEVHRTMTVEYDNANARLRPVPSRTVWISPADGDGPQPPPPPPTQPDQPVVPGEVDVPTDPMPTTTPDPYAAEGEVPLVTPCPLPCDPCEPCFPCADLDPCARWTIQLEGNVTWINDPEGTFGLESFTGQQMNWDGLEYDPAFGGGGMIQYAFRPGTRIQLRGSYLGSFDAEGPTSGQFAFAPPIPGIAAINSAMLTSEAELMTGELNLIHEVMSSSCARFDVGIGARAVYFEETAVATGFGTAFNPGFPGAPYVRSVAEELLIGAQLVTAMHFDLSNCFTVTFGFEPGLGYLTRDLVVEDRSIFAGGEHVSRNDEEQLVFMFEAEISAKWRLTKNIALVGGYRLLFVDEIVRANDAMDFTKSFSGAVQARQETDQLFAHTLFVGVSIDF